MAKKTGPGSIIRIVRIALEKVFKNASIHLRVLRMVGINKAAVESSGTLNIN